jgi:transcriptional regulator with XRE-family HTH domain
VEALSIRERVKAYVSEKGISQKLIAENMGTTEARVSLMLNGKRKMTVDDYVSLCRAIAVSPTRFLIQ